MPKRASASRPKPRAAITSPRLAAHRRLHPHQRAVEGHPGPRARRDRARRRAARRPSCPANTGSRRLANSPPATRRPQYSSCRAAMMVPSRSMRLTATASSSATKGAIWASSLWRARGTADRGGVHAALRQAHERRRLALHRLVGGPALGRALLLVDPDGERARLGLEQGREARGAQLAQRLAHLPVGPPAHRGRARPTTTTMIATRFQKRSRASSPGRAPGGRSSAGHVVRDLAQAGDRARGRPSGIIRYEGTVPERRPKEKGRAWGARPWRAAALLLQNL